MKNDKIKNYTIRAYMVSKSLGIDKFFVIPATSEKEAFKKIEELISGSDFEVADYYIERVDDACQTI